MSSPSLIPPCFLCKYSITTSLSQHLHSSHYKCKICNQWIMNSSQKCLHGTKPTVKKYTVTYEPEPDVVVSKEINVTYKCRLHRFVTMSLEDLKHCSACKIK